MNADMMDVKEAEKSKKEILQRIKDKISQYEKSGTITVGHSSGHGAHHNSSHGHGSHGSRPGTHTR